MFSMGIRLRQPGSIGELLE